MAAFGWTSECLNENCSVRMPAKVGPDGTGGGTAAIMLAMSEMSFTFISLTGSREEHSGCHEWTFSGCMETGVLPTTVIRGFPEGCWRADIMGVYSSPPQTSSRNPCNTFMI